jgi:translation initiation factor IF-3
VEVNTISKMTDRKGDGLVNEEINAREVVVITDTGENLGVQDLKTAIKLASQKNYDLVCVAPNATPPVCRYMDYSKYRYEQQRRAREAKKNQKIISLKEIRLSPGIDKHDFDTKVRNGRKFLTDGDKLKVTLRFRGRMVEYAANARTVFDRFASELDEVATIEQQPILDGRSLIMMLSPKIDKTKK